MKLLYFVPDLSDPTAARRVRLLHAGDLDIMLVGFSRSARKIETIEGVVPVDLGMTRDSRLVGRIGSVFLAFFRIWRLRKSFQNCDVIMARQLEMLVLACMVRLFFRRRAPVVFECLDIHRLMIRHDMVGLALRLLEAGLLRLTDLLVISSPGFLTNYFTVFHRHIPPTYLLENKLLFSEVDASVLNRGDAGEEGGLADEARWKIGWYGVIRCPVSLKLLADLVLASGGRIEVIIAGKIAQNLAPGFDGIVAATPGLSYLGPYDRTRDLGRLYDTVHFTWAIDYYETGGNSEWLLPNRLYEGGVFRSVMLAVAGTQSGHWLAGNGAGIILEEPLETSLTGFFDMLDGGGYRIAKSAMRELPNNLFVYGEADCRAFSARLASLLPAQPTAGSADVSRASRP